MEMNEQLSIKQFNCVGSSELIKEYAVRFSSPLKLNSSHCDSAAQLPPAIRSAVSSEGTTSFSSWLWILPPSKGPISAGHDQTGS